MEDQIRDKVDDFFGRFPLKNYGKGEVIVQGGENPQGIFYLVSGHVKEYDITYSGNEAVINVFKPGSFFPMSWAINKTPNQYFFETTDKVSLRIAPAADVLDFINMNPDVAFDLLKRVYVGLDGILARLKHSMKGSALSKTLLELVIEAKRFGKKTNGSYIVDISEEEFAKRAGVSRETVSRELGVLKSQGLLDVEYGKLRINDIHKLEAMLEDHF